MLNQKKVEIFLLKNHKPYANQFLDIALSSLSHRQNPPIFMGLFLIDFTAQILHTIRISFGRNSGCGSSGFSKSCSTYKSTCFLIERASYNVT